jgi:peroxiredoxin
MRRLLALLLTISLISCADPNSYSIDGKAVGFEDGSRIYVHKILDNNQTEVIDTLTVKNESFSVSYEKNGEQAIHFFKVDDKKNTILFFPENTDLTATIYRDSLESSFVIGSQQNDSYKAFNDKMREFNDIKSKNTQIIKQARLEQDGMLVSETQKENRALVEEENNYKRLFITNNNNSLFSVILLTEMVSRKEVNATEAESIVSNFSPRIAASSSAKLLKRTIDSMKKADVGAKAPDFSAPDPDGEMISLYDVLGKYTIIDFWASWCKPCRRENPNVVNVYNKYHEQGLNIISVSLDKEGQKDRWLKAISDDKLTWHHVSNLKAWRDPIAGLYNVRSIPATFLLDENGVIIAKNLRGPALVNKMVSLFGN